MYNISIDVWYRQLPGPSGGDLFCLLAKYFLDFDAIFPTLLSEFKDPILKSEKITCPVVRVSTFPLYNLTSICGFDDTRVEVVAQPWENIWFSVKI